MWAVRRSLFGSPGTAGRQSSGPRTTRPWLENVICPNGIPSFSRDPTPPGFTFSSSSVSPLLGMEEIGEETVRLLNTYKCQPKWTPALGWGRIQSFPPLLIDHQELFV